MNFTSLLDAIANFAAINGFAYEVYYDPAYHLHRFMIWRDKKNKWSFAMTDEIVSTANATMLFKHFVSCIPVEVWMEPQFTQPAMNTGGYVKSQNLALSKYVVPVTKQQEPGPLGKLGEMFNLEQEVACPSTECMSPIDSLRIIVIHLNDDHKWSRNQIADWLETTDVDITKRQPKNLPPII